MSISYYKANAVIETEVHPVQEGTTARSICTTVHIDNSPPPSGLRAKEADIKNVVLVVDKPSDALEEDVIESIYEITFIEMLYMGVPFRYRQYIFQGVMVGTKKLLTLTNSAVYNNVGVVMAHKSVQSLISTLKLSMASSSSAMDKLYTEFIERETNKVKALCQVDSLLDIKLVGIDELKLKYIAFTRVNSNHPNLFATKGVLT